MLRMRVRPEAFNRIRTKTQALLLDDGDKSGPLLVVLDDIARKSARKAIVSRGDGTWTPLTPRYAAWKKKAGYGGRMMVMNKAYRGRKPEQLLRKFTLARESGHIARWVRGLRFQFGVSDAVGEAHEMGYGTLPRRSVIDFIYGDYAKFVAAFKKFYIARVKQVLRHT